MHEFTNGLINESSPYLLQHAHNPVNWYPWGREALAIAKQENKLLIISIGYSACHWCHVMEHESFENAEVAALMNEHFISIKVDREERPDVDQVYMDAAQITNGQGGWPLNAFALPDGKPFYAATYFPKDRWMEVLNYFVKINRENPAYLIEAAEKLTQGIVSADAFERESSSLKIQEEDLDAAFNRWKPRIDYVRGGEHRAPKFPMPAAWKFLLEYACLTDNPDAEKALAITLEKMCKGGIYDHIVGGFARYSTDMDWLVPHFEKMLYDNAQLVSLYAFAYQYTKNNLYKEVVYQSLQFVERELFSPEGAFYSSLDADSEGEEGKFYVWTKREIEALLGKGAGLYIAYYEVTAQGNWEHGKNILHRKIPDRDIALKYQLNEDALKEKINRANVLLLNAREKRIRPGQDDKILCSWNALMLSGYCHAYRAFKEEHFLQIALGNADFILKNFIREDGEILRNYKNGKVSIHGFLDDYAFVIAAFIDLYQSCFDEQWLRKAHDIAEYCLEHFYDQTSGFFWYTHQLHSNLIARKMEVADNVIPASNSQMAKNLFLLGHYFYRDDYVQKSTQMLANVQNRLSDYLYYHSNWASLHLMHTHPPYEVAILGKDALDIRAAMDETYLPNVLYMGGSEEGSLKLLQDKLVQGKTCIYVCRNKTCQMPVEEIQDAIHLIKHNA